MTLVTVFVHYISKFTVQAWPDTVKLDSMTAMRIDFGLFVLKILLLLTMVAPGIMNGISLQ